jgi:streptogramin lyase
MRDKACLLALLAAGFMAVPVSSQEKGGVDLTGPYDVVANWMKPIEENVTTYVVGVYAESPDRILVTSTGATPGKQVGTFNPKAPGAKLDHLMMVLDRNGKVVEEWRQWFPLWGNPHVVRINPYDPEKHVWFIERENHQIFEFSHDGKTLVKTMGEKGVTAVDETHFGRPAEIAWLPDGTFFVADGYQNRRVVKFDKNGKYLMSWGSEGKGPGQFGGIVHCVAVDGRRRVYVSDSGNRRVQIFDENGKYLDQWSLPGAMHIVVTQDQSVWILDLTAQRILKYNTDGKLLDYWGTVGDFPGGFNGPHDFSVDPEGSLYIDMGFGHRIEKFVPKPNADKKRLVGQPYK